MLDTFEIVTTSGVVLWSRSYTPTSPAIINGLIKNVFIEERTRAGGAGASDDISAANNPPYKHDQHTLKWTTVKELNLIFVVSNYRQPYIHVLTSRALGCVPITPPPFLDRQACGQYQDTVCPTLW